MLHNKTIDTLSPVWIVKYYHRLLLERTIRRTFANWKERCPRWANSGFDEYFLLHDALPLLRDILAGAQSPDPSLLAQEWVTAYGIRAPRHQSAVAELMPVAADFITRLQLDYCIEPSYSKASLTCP